MGGIGRKLKIMVLTAAVLVLGSGPALAGWIFTDLSAWGDIVGESFAGKINNNGDIVGTARFAGQDYNHAVLYSGGVAYDLGTLGSISTAGSINDAGMIVGGSYYNEITGPGLSQHAAIFSTSAPPLDILPLESYPVNATSLVRDINNSGKMVGFVLSDTFDQVPILWNDADNYQILDAGPIKVGYVAEINNVGQMCGSIAVDMTLPGSDYWQYGLQAAFWDADGTLTLLGVFDGWISSTGGLNDLGQVLVRISDDTPDNTWTIVWQNGEIIQELEGLGGGNTEGNAINNNGLIVGESETVDGAMHAVAWLDGQIIDLNDFVSDTDLVLKAAIDVNEQGQIVGYGIREDGKTEFAFLLTPDLTPTPIPASLLLFGSGLAGLGVFRRRFRQG